MEQGIYQKLALHLDNLPGGFPPTESGVELRILKRLFTPDEAELALHLTLIPEGPRVIARRAKLNREETASLLEEMGRKGLIFRIEPEGQAPLLRTIPVDRSLGTHHKVMTYEHAEELVKSQKRFLVAPCICRREATIMGKGCDKPEETCLVFGLGADYYRQNGIGRTIDKEEALDILKRADKAGLVLQPGNAKKIVNICCCQVLNNIKRFPKPASLVSTCPLRQPLIRARAKDVVSAWSTARWRRCDWRTKKWSWIKTAASAAGSAFPSALPVPLPSFVSRNPNSRRCLVILPGPILTRDVCKANRSPSVLPG